MELKKTSPTISWDDAHRPSNVEEGDYFIFIDATTKEKKINPIMYFHEIMEIHNSRKSEWSSDGYIENNIYNTSNRKRLVLNSVISKTEKWNDYFPSVGYKGSHLQCTLLIKSSAILENNN